MESIARIQQAIGILLLVVGALYINYGVSGNTLEDIDITTAMSAIEISDLLFIAGLIFIVCGVLATVWVFIKGGKLKIASKVLFTVSSLILAVVCGFYFYYQQIA